MENKDEEVLTVRREWIGKLRPLAMVMMVLAVMLIAMASPVMADAASDIENLTTTTSAMLMALIPLIITIGIFTMILGLIVFKGMKGR